VRVPFWSPAGAGLGMSSPPPPPVSGEVGDWASYAVAQRHSKKQEDKFLLKVLSTGGTPSWADFCCAVLDGHNGRRAAETCAALLPGVVSEELARLCAASGVTHDAHADAASPNWHPQVRTPPSVFRRCLTLRALEARALLRVVPHASRVRDRLGAVSRGHGVAKGPLGAETRRRLLPAQKPGSAWPLAAELGSFHPRRPARSSTAGSSLLTGS